MILTAKLVHMWELNKIICLYTKVWWFFYLQLLSSLLSLLRNSVFPTVPTVGSKNVSWIISSSDSISHFMACGLTRALHIFVDFNKITYMQTELNVAKIYKLRVNSLCSINVYSLPPWTGESSQVYIFLLQYTY